MQAFRRCFKMHRSEFQNGIYASLAYFDMTPHVNPRLCLTSGTRVPLEDRRSGKHTLVQQNHHDGVDQYPTPSTAASPKQWDGMRPVTLFHRA